jgi:DnaK suppressor protein
MGGFIESCKDFAANADCAQRTVAEIDHRMKFMISFDSQAAYMLNLSDVRLDRGLPKEMHPAHQNKIRFVKTKATLMARKDIVKAMREVLVQRRNALRMALKGDFSMLHKMRQETVGDVVDFAMDSSNDEINSQLAEVESRELASIEIALEKMKQGSYGKCEACNKSIPIARLQALPYATLCIDCQREAENGSLGPVGTDWSRLGTGPQNNVGDVDFNIS